MKRENDEWDGIYRETPLGNIPWHSEKPPFSLVRAVSNIKRGTALDVCCGAGTNSIYLAREGFSVRGIDISERAIEIAGERARKEGLEIDFEAGDVMGLEEKGVYDFVFDRGCFHHMPGREKPGFVRRVHRALKKGGKYMMMAFSFRNGFDKSLSKQDIRRLFSGYFKIGPIREELNIEPSGRKVYLYVTPMTKRDTTVEPPGKI